MKTFLIKSAFMLGAGVALILYEAPLWGAIVGSWVALIALEVYRINETA